MAQRLSWLVVALWAGALWMAGLTANILFKTLPDRQLAGNVAGQIFTFVSYIGLASGLYLLIYQWLVFGKTTFKQSYFWVVLAMLMLVIIGNFGIQTLLQNFKNQAQPLDVMQSIYASQFKMWHGVAGVIYLIECLLAIAMVLKVNRHK